MEIDEKIRYLIEKGVNIPVPHSVEIGEEVDIDRISGEGVTVHSGSKIFGSSTFIAKGCVIGKEGPATLDNCWLGRDVKINGGYVASSVFLDKVSVGYGAHIREGSILEEEASVAHTVGLKQTLLFPFVTLGSLINFCDCFMAGGTSRKNHSEVGSSYIHFNYTPNQDKATASLLGDVPHGVMLKSKPIFLGGQGGLVGPVRLNFGTVIAAGTIQRKDEMEPDRLIFGGALRPGNIKHTPGVFQNIPRVVKHNLNYIANLIALLNWYAHVRARFVSDSFPTELLEGLKQTLSIAVRERVKRLKDFLEKASFSGASSTEHLMENWDLVDEALNRYMTLEKDFKREIRDSFTIRLDETIKQAGTESYIKTIQAFNEETSSVGTTWLSAIVADVYEKTIHLIPGIKP